MLAVSSRFWPYLVVVAAVSLSSCSSGAADVAVTSTGTGRQAELDQVRTAQEAQYACMADLGYVVSKDEDGRTVTEPMAGDAGDQKFFADLEACAQQHPLPPIAPMERGELERLYEAQLKRAECIKKQGYETVPPPSLDTYVAEMQRPPDAVVKPPWDPLDVSIVGGEAIMKLQEVCPRPSIYTLDE